MKLFRIRVHAQLFVTLFRLSFISDIQYRANVIVKIFADICWYCGQLAVFEVLYLHTPDIAGWTIYDARILLSSLFLADAVFMVIFSDSMERFSDKVIKGDLDLLLVKPVSSQFLMSCQKMNTAYLANVVMSGVFLTFMVLRLPSEFSYLRYFAGLSLVLTSVLITYGFRIFFAMMAVIYSKVDALNYLWYQIYRFGTRPDPIYPNYLRYIFLSVVPLAFMASVPARIFSGKSGLDYYVAGLILPFIMLYVVSKIWGKVIKQYSSASS